MEIPNYKGKIKNWIPWENRRLMMGENRYIMGWGKGRNYHPDIVRILVYAEVSLIDAQVECQPIAAKKDIDYKKLICTKLNQKKGKYERNYEMVSSPFINSSKANISK